MSDNLRKNTALAMMDRAALLSKIFWHVQSSWHLRQRPTAQTLSLPETIKGLQTLLLVKEGAILHETLQRLYARPVALSELQRLTISLYQEGIHQRVWRCEVALVDQAPRSFGIIVSRALGESSRLTQRDFSHLQLLHKRHARYCVAPYACGVAPIADGVAAYTVEWLEHHKELVFEITVDGGVFFVNAVGAQRYFSPRESRQIWRHIVDILWHYPDLRAVNIQAGDFVGLVHEDGQIALKLTTAREIAPTTSPAARIHTMLGWMITASGYLSDGRQPFARHMTAEQFFPRMQTVLQRRFGAQASALAHRQWQLFQAGAFAQQEQWLQEDVVGATYAHVRATSAAPQAWAMTCQWWHAYAEAVRAGSCAPSWWFPITAIPPLLHRLRQQEGHNYAV